MRECKVIIFGALGDCVNATTLLLPLRAKYDRTVWITRRKFADVVRGNPLVDEVQTYADDTDNATLHAIATPSAGVITPAPYLERYGKLSLNENSSLLGWFEQLRVQLGLPTSAPFEPLLYLTEEERTNAQHFAKETGPFVLIETKYGSDQSYWNDDCTKLAIEKVTAAKLEPVMVSYDRVPWITSLERLGFREVAALYNHAAGFIGVSSGISCLVGAQCFRKDVPHVEFVRGGHWSTFLYKGSKKKIVLKPALVPVMLDWLIEQIGGG